MNIKRNILLVSAAYVVFFIGIFLTSELCNAVWCRINDDDPLGSLFFTLLPLLPVFFLSLVTYFMREEVFRAWWRFARWWVLVIIVITLLLNNASGGGTLGMERDFTIFILTILYSILIITSLTKIVRTYLKTKTI